jgi:ABC-type polysaccharide/polyol phosphate export permease
MKLTQVGHELSLALSLALQDVKQAYRRSSLGAFWLTIGMSVQIVAIGLVFGLIFGVGLQEFLPFLATSLILWSFFSSSILDGSMGFVTSEAILRQLPIPHYVHLLRSLWKNVLMLGHNLVILPVVFLVFLRMPTWNLLLLVPGFILTTAFLFSATYVLALITTRFRDMQQILSSVMTVVFYVTPVIWQPSLIPGGTAHLLLGLNPFYHFLQIIRLPILGQAPTLENWSLAIVITLLTGVIAYLAAKKYKNRLAYWV